MDVDLKEIGKRLQDIRKSLGLLQKDFAKELEISSSSLCDIEAGNLKPRFELIYSITRKFKVNILYLLHGEGDMFIPEEEKLFSRSDVLDKYRDWFKDFIYYFENSPVVRYAIMSFYFSYLTENEKLIKTDLDKHKPKKGEQKGKE